MYVILKTTLRYYAVEILETKDDGWRAAPVGYYIPHYETTLQGTTIIGVSPGPLNFKVYEIVCELTQDDWDKICAASTSAR